MSGQPCFAYNITGQDLGNGDRFMVLETCGLFTAPRRFTGGGVSDLMSENGTLATWGQEPTCMEPYNFDCRGVRPTSQGGNFRLCWCAHNYTCSLASDFRVDIGHLSFLGPYPLTNSRTCVAGQPCAFSGIEGHYTQDGDKLMALDTCAHPETLQLIQSSDKWGIYNQRLVAAGQYGWFDGPSNNASSNGSSFLWGAVDQVITSPGGLYRMCWCAANYPCLEARDFQTDVGELNVIGPFLELPDPTGLLTLEQRLQSFTCTTNEPCSVSGLQGQFLSDGDLLMVKRDCSPAWEFNSTVPYWPSNTFVWGIADPGIVETTVNGITYQTYNWAVIGTTSEREVRSEGAYYRLCWCAAGYTCADPIDFAVDAGTMKLIGPHHNQAKTCFSGAACTASSVTGVGLSNGDRTMVLRYCDTDLYIARFPNEGYSDPAVDNGTTITWSGAAATPVTSPGGFYKLCWCGASQTCTRSGSNFRVEYGLLYIVGPSPLTQSKTCLSGELCAVEDFAGYGLSSGDRMMISSNCGDPNGVIPRFPNMGISGPSTNNGTTFVWDDYVTAGGGIYWMCWCSNMYSCDRADLFNVESGLLTLPGPYLGQERTCRSGTECGFSTLRGLGLADGDRIMIMNQCGTNSILPGWPDNGVSDPAIFQGTEYAWGISSGGLHVTGAGGEYSMCWCSISAPNCSSGEYFRTEVGIMKMLGPAIGQRKYCTSGQVCSITQFGGYELQNGDRILISPSCLPSNASYIEGFSNNGISVGTAGGSRFDFEGRLTASGGVYAMCWCPSGSPCQSPDNFQVDTGNLTVIGPFLDHQKTCISSQVCRFDGFLGQSLLISDRITVLATCGTSFVLPRMPNSALSTEHSNFGNSVSWGPLRATAPGGQYRLCWCAATSKCSSPTDYVVDSGELHIIGPNLYQMQQCYPGVTCSFEDFLGYGLQNGERIMVLDVCGLGAGVPGFPNGAISNLAVSQGMQYGWGDGSSSTDYYPLNTSTPGGFYRLCWCPVGLETCDTSQDFRVDAGALIVKGPFAQVNTLCAAGQTCTLGPWDGALLALSDRVLIIPDGATCGQSAADVQIAQGEPRGVTCNLELTTCEASLSSVETQHGGLFKVCYCVTYLDTNGTDTLPCTEPSEFTSYASNLQACRAKLCKAECQAALQTH